MRTTLAFVLVLALCTAVGLGAQSAVSGIVKDPNGGAVSGASVMVVGSGGLEQQTVTGLDGRFTLTTPPSGDLTLIVRAGGFAEWSQSVPANREVDVVLSIADQGGAGQKRRSEAIQSVKTAVDCSSRRWQVARRKRAPDRRLIFLQIRRPYLGASAGLPIRSYPSKDP